MKRLISATTVGIGVESFFDSFFPFFYSAITDKKMSIMKNMNPAFVITVALFLASCSAAPTKFMYRGKDDPGKEVHYLSKDQPSFVMTIPGISWEVRSVQYNHTLLLSTSGPRKTINIFEYSDGLLVKRYYKSGASEEQALEEYYRFESEYQLSQIPDGRSQILAKNISGVNKPNLLWKIESPTKKVVLLTTSRDRHLIGVSWQDIDPPFVGEQKVVEILGSLKFVSPEEADTILHSQIASSQ